MTKSKVKWQIDSKEMETFNHNNKSCHMCKKTLHFLFIFVIYLIHTTPVKAQTLDLNGTWQFDQTITAFPPGTFTRTIPVPGLISLATPRIDQYDVFFRKPGKAEYKSDADLSKPDYTPKYSWYKKSITIPAAYRGKEAVLILKKSQYVTQVYVNGRDMGTSVSCFTPIVIPITSALQFGTQNDILVKVGDRTWLPANAAGGTDKEKEHYLPGIWDDVSLRFSEKFRVQKALLLPSLSQKSVTAKVLIRSFYPSQITFGAPKGDTAQIKVSIYEKLSNRQVSAGIVSQFVKRDDNTPVELTIPVSIPHAWSPDDPFLYTAKVEVLDKGKQSDSQSFHFAMRDFGRIGKQFYLNGKQIYLRGSNITLQRFFEDPDSKDLAWNHEWVKKMMIDYAKELNWNTYRICVGLVPDFWYDLADEHGILLQNEWMYWQDHGWNDEIRAEYTDWVWSDGNHPSIVIWDGINENWNKFIGNELIPELKKLDPTRFWDSGFMTSQEMTQDEMDEPHPYMGALPFVDIKKFAEDPYPLGDLDYTPQILKDAINSGQAQMVNEYGWVWTWRDGQPSKLTLPLYRYYLGNNLGSAQTRSFQAYWLQLETEWLRSHRELGGVLAFTHLTNNFGYTGDWFSNITNLTPTPALQWFKHCFAPAAVFIDLMDERYMKQAVPHKPGETFAFNLVGINDNNEPVSGKVRLELFDSIGKAVVQKEYSLHIKDLGKNYLPVTLQLPFITGGYTMIAEFDKDGGKGMPVISRRYIKVGQMNQYKYYEPLPGTL